MKQTQSKLERQVQLNKVKAKNKKRYSFSELSKDPKWIGKVSSVSKLCSCWMCGNQRKWFGKTMKEKSFEELTRILGRESMMLSLPIVYFLSY